MITKIRMLSKSKTAKWATVLAMVSTMVITNQSAIIDLSSVLFGAGSSDIVSKVISIIAVLVGYVGTLNGRLDAERMDSVPLNKR